MNYNVATVRNGDDASDALHNKIKKLKLSQYGHVSIANTDFP